jgi:hypothetical protein
MSALEERRQAAREAFYDANHVTMPDALNEAIGTATRVQITDEVLIAAVKARRAGPDTEGIIKAAFVAAGFEVEQT